jgi:hypothetical protein
MKLSDCCDKPPVYYGDKETSVCSQCLEHTVFYEIPDTEENLELGNYFHDIYKSYVEGFNFSVMMTRSVPNNEAPPD